MNLDQVLVLMNQSDLKDDVCIPISVNKQLLFDI